MIRLLLYYIIMSLYINELITVLPCLIWSYVPLKVHAPHCYPYTAALYFPQIAIEDYYIIVCCYFCLDKLVVLIICMLVDHYVPASSLLLSTECGKTNNQASLALTFKGLSVMLLLLAWSAQ